jgi:hypothetical protein
LSAHYALVLGLAAAAQAHDVPGSYNGSWWARQSQNAQIAYVAGDTDCYSYEVLGTAFPATGLSEQTATRVTQYLQRQPAEAELPLAISFRHIFAKDRHPRATEETIGSAEYWPEEHGFFDGDYWYQLQGAGERTSYVAAYLACEATFRHKTMNHSVDYYVRAVNRWYGTRDDDENLNAARENEKIATVIQRALRQQR